MPRPRELRRIMRLIIVFAIAALAVAGLLPRYVDRIAGHAAAPPTANAGILRSTALSMAAASPSWSTRELP